MKVNALGVDNVCRAASESENVEAVIYTSTDKASFPSGVYGHTKAIGESIMKSYSKLYDKKFVTARFANVLGSTGSVIPIFKDRIKSGKSLVLRDEHMTRFFLSKEDAVKTLVNSLTIDSGNIIVPLCTSMRIKDLAEIMIERSNKDIGIKVSSPLPYEKIDESLISGKGLRNIVEKRGNYFVLDIEHVSNNEEQDLISNNEDFLLNKEGLRKFLIDRGLV